MLMGTSGSLAVWTMSSTCLVRSKGSMAFSQPHCRHQAERHLHGRDWQSTVFASLNSSAAGHRIGTAEVENTLTDHSACSEAAVIG